MKRLTTLPLAMAACLAWTLDSPQFRGPDRNGVFPATGLLEQWPEAGPKELWSSEGLGKSFASVAIVGDRLYTTGMFDNEGFLFALDLKGNHIYKVSYGPEFPNGYPGARTTPTVNDGAVYVMSSEGRLSSFNAADGKLNWAVETLDRFKGSGNARDLIPRWGIAESVLVVDDMVVCTPGGKNASLAAFHKKTGDLVWQTKGLSEISGYCSARLLDNGRVRQIITLTGESLVGVDPENGKVVWRQAYEGRYDIHAVSPVFLDNYIYVTDGYRQGGAMFELAADGSGVSKRWTEKTLDCHHGGVVEAGGYIYGANSRGDWICLDFKTGEQAAKTRGVGKGAAVYADGKVYGYGERGLVGLFNADPKDFRLISSFEVEKGSGRHWSHPVILDGVLYIRHGDALMAYDIRK